MDRPFGVPQPPLMYASSSSAPQGGNNAIPAWYGQGQFQYPFASQLAGYGDYSSRGIPEGYQQNGWNRNKWTPAAPQSYSNNNGPKKRKPVKKPQPEAKFCDICNITCGCEQSYQAHIVGKIHKRREQVAKNAATADAAASKPKSPFSCEVCNTTCSNADALKAHINGSRHIRAIKLLRDMGKPVPAEAQPSSEPVGDPMSNLPVERKIVGVTATSFVGGAELNTTDLGVNELVLKDEEELLLPPIGEEFLEPINTGARKQQFRCKLCECMCGDPAAKDMHCRGRRHRMAFKRKIDQSITVDVKASRNSVPPKISRLSTAQEQLSNIPALDYSFTCPSFPQRRVPHYLIIPESPRAVVDTTQYDEYDERLIRERVDQLSLTAERLQEVDKLITTAECLLKEAADSLAENVRKGAEKFGIEISEDSSGTSSALDGVIRVGPLGEGLLLMHDQKLEAALICKCFPSVALLTEIKRLVDTNKSKDENMSVDADSEKASLTFKFHSSTLSFVITLTSLLYDNDSSKPNAPSRPTDCLPDEPCKNVLKAIDQTKYYLSKCATIPHMPETIVLLRDIASRVPTWRFLPLFAIQLICKHALSSPPTPTRVSDAFRRIFEVFSAGMFFSKGQKLADPDNENVNILMGLSAQEKENIVCSAQHARRLIAYDQLSVVLGLGQKSSTRDSAEKSENSSKTEPNQPDSSEKEVGSSEKSQNTETVAAAATPDPMPAEAKS